MGKEPFNPGYSCGAPELHSNLLKKMICSKIKVLRDRNGRGKKKVKLTFILPVLVVPEAQLYLCLPMA